MPTAADYRDTHRDIVLGCQRKDRTAQRQLYGHYAKPMYNVCLRILKHAHDAEDVLQLAFVQVFSKINTFNFEASVSAWIKRIVVNRCIDHLKKRRLLTTAFDPVRHDHGSTEEDTPLDAPCYTVERIRAAVRQLSEGYRVVLSLYLFEGYDHEEISQILGISVGTSKSQYSRARRRLAQLLTTPQ
ncbi:ECF RNA polymerase sigma factor SigW [Neolewinella maritima]|uniref:RNA polymerase sigma factor n=1 Tax=Neolewinella maritima TaxID=1383882 RepID=A0ABM9B528_9BACT|nr:sigma-70 family RNA polymerase sigma factor [Neolewinella maritima]CAH1002489.1 ECF RNA polymerase sigma factor SigW [Neolewinella maritima]